MKTIKTIIIIALVLTPAISYAQTLEDYFAEVAEQNPGLKARYLEFEAALQKIDQVNALPDINFSFGYFISPVETRVGPQRARFSLSQTFPWFGTLAAQDNAAALLAEAKYQSFLDARNQLYYKLAAVYYPLYELEEKIQIQKENLGLLESYKTISNAKFENSQGTMADVLRADILMNEAKTEIEVLAMKRRPLRVAFNKLLNREDTVEVVVQDTVHIKDGHINHRTDSLFEGHPRLESLNLQAKAMVEQEKAAQKQGMPRFGVGIDYVLVDKRTDLSPEAGAALADNGKNALMPMVSLSIPLFSNKYRAEENEARLRQEMYRKLSEETENDLVSDYENTWFEMEKSRHYINLYQQQVRETRQTLNLLFTTYANAGNDFEEVLRVQQQLLKYELQLVSTITSYKVAEAKLDYIISK